MPLLVLAALAGIIGYVGYRESAKIEKRFRRGPLGIRAWQWGVGCAGAGLIIAIPASALVVGAFVGYFGYDETAKYDEQHGNLPFGVPPLGWAVACFGLATIGAILTSAVAVGAIVAFVVCSEAAMYERQFGRPFGGRGVRLPSLLWGAAGFFSGLIGALVTSTLTWGVACSFVALAAALALLIVERNALVAEKAALVAEKDALIAERSGRRPAGSNASAVPAAAPAPATAAPATAAPAAAKPRPRRQPEPAAASGWPARQPAAPRTVGAPSDLLPHRR